MSVSPRQVKNKRNADGVLTGKAGTVYDVRVKYKTMDGEKVYTKKGFPTKKLAEMHEAEMRVKLSNPAYSPSVAAKGKISVHEYLKTWLEQYCTMNLRPNTISGYSDTIKNHINPIIGTLSIQDLTPDILDRMFQKLFEKGLSSASVQRAHIVMSSAMEAAKKYHYIESNPARDTLTKFSSSSNTPEPYTIPQLQQLLHLVSGTEWEMMCVLGGLYGLRISEVLGLRWDNVDLEHGKLNIAEQLPAQLPYTTKIVAELAPPKSTPRLLAITDITRPYFIKQLTLQTKQKELADSCGIKYYDNRLVVAKPDGTPYRRENTSARFGYLLKKLNLQHLRFHDLRHPYVKATT